MDLRFIDWIWHIRGRLALAPGQTSVDALDRLDPLFLQAGTSRKRTGDTLCFTKKDQAAQDKMSVFDDGTLRIEQTASGSVLRYHLTSRILLFCFLAPLLFLSIAAFTKIMVKSPTSAVKATSTSGKASGAQGKPAVKQAAVPQNAIDKFLGAPVPENPKKKDADKPGGRGKRPSPTPAYVFAAIFAVLYIVGRILEDRLIRTLFRTRLMAI